MDDFMTFISSNEAINKNFEFLMYGLDINNDQMAGLDSYTSENDERMLELMAESKKKQGGHWSYTDTDYAKEKMPHCVNGRLNVQDKQVLVDFHHTALERDAASYIDEFL